MTKLTTHVLDTYSGKPGKNIRVDVYYVSNKSNKINSVVLNNDGRSEKPLIEGSNFREGEYELIFHVGDYFKTITDLYLSNTFLGPIYFLLPSGDSINSPFLPISRSSAIKVPVT